MIIPTKIPPRFLFFPTAPHQDAVTAVLAFGLFLHRVDSRGSKHGVQMNQEAGMEVDGGGGGGEAGPASGTTTTTRVRFCLSRRGCRWAEDISSGDRRQASAGDAAGVWVSETEASFSLRSGRLCPLLSRSLISSSSVSILVLPPGTTARLLVHESGWGWRLATSMCVARAALCTFTTRGSLCFRALPPKKKRVKSHVLLCSVARCWVLAIGFGPSVRSLSCACYLLLTHACLLLHHKRAYCVLHTAPPAVSTTGNRILFRVARASAEGWWRCFCALVFAASSRSLSRIGLDM